MARRLHAHLRLLDRWRTDDLAVAALDAAGVGSCGGAIRLHRTAIVGAFWQARFAHHRGTRRDQHSVLRRNGPKDSLVAFTGCRMISFTPWYIILGEFGIALVFALLARILRRSSWRMAIIAGFFGAISIFGCYAVAFLLTDQLVKL